MDKFKSTMNRKCGVAGLFCRCCNDFHGKTKKRLNRMARRIIKQEDRKEF